MAIIEQIEKQELQNLITNKYFYVVVAAFMAPLSVAYTGYNLWVLALIAIVFAIVFCIDVKEYIIPDTAQAALFLLSNILIFNSDYRSFTESYAGFAFAGLMFFAIYLSGPKFFKKDILGFGDVKLMFNIGLLLGFLSFNYFLWILTALSGIFVLAKKLIFKKSGAMPYGPFIVISAWICLLYKDNLDIINYSFMHYIAQ